MNAPHTTRDGDGGAGCSDRVEAALLAFVAEGNRLAQARGDESVMTLRDFAIDSGEDAMEDIRKCMAAAIAAAPAVGGRARGEGFVLVPREPTPEMLRASRRAIGDLIEGMSLEERTRRFSRSKEYGFKVPTDQKAAARYRAMIAAAPSQGSDTRAGGEEIQGASFGPDHPAEPEPVPVSAPSGGCSSRGPAETWRPIGTAPRDGTEVYLWAEAWEGSWGVQIGRFEGGQWRTEEGAVNENEPDFDPNAEVGEDYNPDDDRNIGPTHWAPFGRPQRPPPAPVDAHPQGGAVKHETRHVTARLFLNLLAQFKYGLPSTEVPLGVLYSTRQWCRRHGYAEHLYHGPGNVDPRWHLTESGKAYIDAPPTASVQQED